MLKIEIQFAERFLTTSFKGQTIRWPYSVWNRIPQESTENIFGAINAYLATLPEETQAKLWTQYEVANALCFLSANANREAKMKEVFNAFEKELEFNSMHRFFVESGFVVPDENIPETNTTNNSDEMTILRHEAMEIQSFSNVVKLFTPILGTRIHLAKKDAGTIHKEIVACKPLKNSKFKEWMPFCRIADYLGELAKNRRNGIDPALTCGLPLSALEDYLMGLALARRLAILPLKHPTNEGRRAPTLVAYIYTYLDDQIKVLKNGQWKDKGIGRESERGGQEADSVSDSYRVSQDVVDEVIVEAEVQLITHFVQCCGFVGLSSTAEIDNALTVYRTLNNHESYRVFDDFQLVIPALVLRKVISPSIFKYLGREARIAAIAITAIKVLKDGYKDIYQLLLAVREEKQLDEMDIGMQNDHQFLKMSDEAQQALMDIYPHRRPIHIRDKTCPGIITIKAIMDVVKSHRWIGLEDPINLRTSLAMLYVDQSTKHSNI